MFIYAQVIAWTYVSNSLMFIPRQWIAESYWQLYVKHFEILPTCFPKWLYHFTVPSALYEDTNFATSSSTLFISWFLILAFLVSVRQYLFVILICISLIVNEFEVSLHVLFGHLYIFFGEMSIQVLCLFFVGLFVFLLLVARAVYIFWVWTKFYLKIKVF